MFLGLLLATVVSVRASHPPPGDSVARENQRRWLFTGVAYGVGQAGLYAAWYRHQPRQQFQFFDDGAQWKQMDKVGHFYSGFQLSRAGTALVKHVGTRWSSEGGGGVVGFLSLLPVEVFDGFSQAYGFSWHDLAANAAGSAWWVGQHALWGEVRLEPKFSFHRTALAAERPNTLGRNLPEEVLKDYNGQTYWLSVDLYAFLKRRYPRFPKWLNVAVGYGANQMLHAREPANQAAGYSAYREWYLALDVDLHYYRKPPVTFGNRLWNGLLYAVTLVRLPAPAVSYRSGKGFAFHPAYF